MIRISLSDLDALLKGNFDKDAMIFNLAKRYPDVFEKLINFDELEDEIEKAYKGASNDTNKVAAIKKYRELTGTGLKEAKDAVEYWLQHGVLPDD